MRPRCRYRSLQFKRGFFIRSRNLLTHFARRFDIVPYPPASVVLYSAVKTEIARLDGIARDWERNTRDIHVKVWRARFKKPKLVVQKYLVKRS